MSNSKSSEPPKLEYYGEADYQSMPWKNGGGQTLELLRQASSNRYAWRISIADIDASTVFSLFPGYHREQVLLAGNGFRLSESLTVVADVSGVGSTSSFEGEDRIFCQLHDGPVQVLNVINNRRHCRVHLCVVGAGSLKRIAATTSLLMVFASQQSDCRLAGQPVTLAPKQLLKTSTFGLQELSVQAGEVILIEIEEL